MLGYYRNVARFLLPIRPQLHGRHTDTALRSQNGDGDEPTRLHGDRCGPARVISDFAEIYALSRGVDLRAQLSGALIEHGGVAAASQEQ